MEPSSQMHHYELIGSNTSPYSRKMLAILRYRRLPYIWRIRHPATLPFEIAGEPRLMPMLRVPGSTRFESDSTLLAHMLEARHGDRSIIPPDAAAAFLCHLIEDFADEWCTKCMFYFRWGELETAMFASRFVISDLSPGLDPQSRDLAVREFFDRQRGRMELVGCAPPNDALIEAHFEEILNALKSLGGADRYLFGTRPSLADFAIYGQLTQLVLDPSPQSRVREVAPIIENWVCRLDDASGVEGEWQDAVYPATEAQLALLRMIGRSYLPFLAANATAIEAGHPGIRMIIDGHPFSQPVFKYQVKCYREILRRWSTLGEHDQNELAPLLSETGCLPHLRTQS